MTKPEFRVRARHHLGVYHTNHEKYYEFLPILLQDLESCLSDITAAWPKDATGAITEASHPHIYRLCVRRDSLTDSMTIYAAMCLKATLNYYGVRRLGDRQFRLHVERLPMKRKLQLLLLWCENTIVDPEGELLQILSRVTQRRNQLVYPTTQEVDRLLSADERGGRPCVEIAREALADSRAFFRELLIVAPETVDVHPVVRGV